MLNQVILVGRLVETPEIITNEQEQKKCTITLAVSRSYKNEEGIYETDFVDCVLWHGVAENTAEYCKKGDIIGIKGRIETINKDNDKKTIIIADRVTSLSSKKTDE